MSRFYIYRQMDSSDCGPACLRMVARHYGLKFSQHYFRTQCHITRAGVTLRDIKEAAEVIGLKTNGGRFTLNQLIEDVPLPCILLWNNNHYVVCYNVKKRRDRVVFQIADPAVGAVTCEKKEMESHWIKQQNCNLETGLILQILPGENTDIEEKQNMVKCTYNNANSRS